MYIDRLIVKGYRSLCHIDLHLKPGKNILVGQNSTGKSNIVDALDIVLGERSPTSAEITPDDFYTDSQGKRETAFWVLCSIKGNDWDHSNIHTLPTMYRTAVGFANNPLYCDSNGNLTVNEDQVFFDPSDLRRDTEKETLTSSKMSEFVRELKEADFSAFVFRAKMDSLGDENAAKDFRFIYSHKVDGRTVWHVVWGIKNEFRQAFLTSAVLRSFRDPGSVLRITNSSWYGKLMTTTWEKAVSSIPDLQARLISSFNAAERVGNEVYSRFSKDLDQTLQIGFRDTRVTFKFSDTSPSDFHKQVRVYVDDGLDSPLIRKGAGIQSAVIIGLFSYYCQTHHNTTSVLVVEEPEIFLHPHARRAISSQLDRFVNPHFSGRENQLIITTHSPEYVQTGNANAITVVRKVDGQSRIKTLDLTSVDVKAKQRMLRANSVEMFFADRVILCEGAEAYLIPRVAEMTMGSSSGLDISNISVIRVDGKKAFKSYTSALEQLDIPWFILADFDFFLDGLGHFLTNTAALNNPHSQLMKQYRDGQSEQDRLKGVRKVLKNQTSNLYNDFAEAMEKFRANPTESNRETVFKLWHEINTTATGKVVLNAFTEQQASQLKEFLDTVFEKMNIWILSRGELEDYVMSSKRKDLCENGKVKDAKLHEVCINPVNDLSDYFELEEFETFVKAITNR